MNANALKWCEALESGDFEQGHRPALRENGKYDAFGVACQISGLGEWGPADVDDMSTYLGWRAIVPVQVSAWLGLRERYGKMADPARRSIGEMDGARLSFDEIAAIIRSEPEGLFVEDAKP